MSDHAECRRTEQRLREANRRLQAEGPALERDKLVKSLRAELAAMRELVVELLCEYRSHGGHQACRSGSRCYVPDNIDKLEALIGADVIKRELLPPRDREPLA